VEGRNLKGIHFAMEFLTQQNRINHGTVFSESERIHAGGKSVVVIGGGDTGSDCVGTSIRQGAKSVTQIEILPKPPAGRNPDNPWPYWANVLRYSSSHEEGCERKWSLSTRKFTGERGNVRGIEVEEVEWNTSSGKPVMKEKPGSVMTLNADLVLLAMGFVHCIHEGLVKEFDLELDPRGNIKVDTNLHTSKPKIFAAGDAVTGASLVVRAIRQGRVLAKAVDKFLQQA